jgi:hypothetical protein
MSSEQLNTALVLILSTKLGQHQVIDMLIDRRVTTGVITVPRGFTPAEITVLRKQFKVLGEEKGKKPKSEPQPTPVTTPPPPPQTARARKPSTPPASSQELRNLDLPRLQD